MDVCLCLLCVNMFELCGVLVYCVYCVCGLALFRDGCDVYMRVCDSCCCIVACYMLLE